MSGGSSLTRDLLVATELAGALAFVAALVLPVCSLGKRGVGGYPRRALAMGLLFLPFFVSLIPVLAAWPHMPEGPLRALAMTGIWVVSVGAAYCLCFVTLYNFSVTRELLDDGMTLSEDVLKAWPNVGP